MMMVMRAKPEPATGGWKPPNLQTLHPSLSCTPHAAFSLCHVLFVSSFCLPAKTQPGPYPLTPTCPVTVNKVNQNRWIRSDTSLFLHCHAMPCACACLATALPLPAACAAVQPISSTSLSTSLHCMPATHQRMGRGACCYA